MKESNGRGSIVYEPKRKKYRAFFTTPGKRRISRRFDSRKEASDWLASQNTSAISGTYTEPSRLPLGEWLVQWLTEYKKPSVSVRTYDRYLELAEHFDALANTPLQKLTPQSVQSLYNELLKSLSPATIERIHRVGHAATQRANLLGLVAYNVFDAIERPKSKSIREIEIFTKDELAAIHKAAKKYANGRYMPLINLAIVSGARRGELLALRVKDLGEHEIRICRNLQETARSGIIINPPKTKAGNRRVSIPPSVMAELKHLAQGKPPDALIFTTRKNTPLSPRNMERAWRIIVEVAEVPYRNFHVLRHTNATDLLANGIPIVEVARRLGHSRISHTLELYGHAIPTYDATISRQIEALYTFTIEKNEN